MRRLKLVGFILVASILLLPPGAFALTAEEIIERGDENKYLEQVRMETELIIKDGKRELTKEMIIYIAGDSVVVEFTNPDDKGTKYLKIGDDLWVLFPNAGEPVKISNQMLERTMVSGDFSYQDLMEQEQLLELYEFEIVGEESYQGRDSYLIEGSAKEGVETSYSHRRIWVDQERFIYLKEELYSQQGRLLRTVEAEEVEQFGERWYVTESVINYKLRASSQTVFRIKAIDFEPEISEDTFKL
ncbi:outer membrane lipoprotein-sorting protein [Natroniella acetigena]|uniref:outer membrane lipoprotein-sorting protein n=1 Tax=Natroniella acetigena TaxID=52004 RepID=UPI00200AFEB6|nr:outer membrane lipoprotein-sorting protein [Natroniella acetigena]MCK8826818.1 outer membrane lipoprotein-sorting protein [Natroniella acetigena]